MSDSRRRPVRCSPPFVQTTIASRDHLIEGLERRLCLSALAFLPPTQYSTHNPSDNDRVAVADFNNDRKPDLAVSSYDTVSVFLNQGSGTFGEPMPISLEAVSDGVATGDFNLDGFTDVAVTLINLSTVRIYYGKGNGTFDNLAFADMGTHSSTHSMAVADFNEDGYPDLAVTCLEDNVVSVLLNGRNGTFANDNYIVASHPTSVVVDDYDRDRGWDLAVACTGAGPGVVSVLLDHTRTDPNDSQAQIPDGSFVPAVNYNVGFEPVSIAPGYPDINGDAYDDLAVANSFNGTISLLASDGDGEFEPATSTSVGDTLTALGSADFTGSHHTDLAAAVGSDIKISLGNGNGTFQAPVSFSIGATITGSMVVADLNADAKPDIVVTDYFGDVDVLLAGSDTVAPQAALAAPLANITAGGGRSYTFDVKYSDNKAVRASTITTGAVLVTGPHGYARYATLVTSDVASVTPLTVTYQITPSNDVWDADSNGVYTISLVGGHVSDPSGNFAAGRSLGTFTIKITLGAIGGSVFNDVNSNGLRDLGDSPIANVRLYIDANKNGTFDSTEKSLLTDGMGGYRFTSLPAGNYRIREVVPAGRRISSPAAGYFDVVLATGQFFTDETFFNTARSLISGTIVNDVNSDGVKLVAEKGLANWTVYLDSNKNGVLDSAEVRTVTDASGNYAFRTLAAGSYRVREVLKAGFRRTSPSAGYYDVTLATGGAAVSKSFLNTSNVLISGTVFNDANGNKLRDTVKNVPEAGLPNWRIYIDTNKNGVFDSGEVSTLSDAAGNWVFKTLQARAAAYIVRIVQQSNWTRTAPAPGTPAGGFTISLTAAGGSRTALQFGEKRK